MGTNGEQGAQFLSDINDRASLRVNCEMPVERILRVKESNRLTNWTKPSTDEIIGVSRYMEAANKKETQGAKICAIISFVIAACAVMPIYDGIGARILLFLLCGAIGAIMVVGIVRGNKVVESVKGGNFKTLHGTVWRIIPRPTMENGPDFRDIVVEIKFSDDSIQEFIVRKYDVDVGTPVTVIYCSYTSSKMYIKAFTPFMLSQDGPEKA